MLLCFFLVPVTPARGSSPHIASSRRPGPGEMSAYDICKGKGKGGYWGVRPAGWAGRWEWAGWERMHRWFATGTSVGNQCRVQPFHKALVLKIGLI